MKSFSDYVNYREGLESNFEKAYSEIIKNMKMTGRTEMSPEEKAALEKHKAQDIANMRKNPQLYMGKMGGGRSSEW